MNLGQLQKRIEGPDLITDNLLSDSMALVEHCNREIRTISHLLHPPLLDELGLRRALQDYIEGFAGRGAIATTLDVAEDLDRLPAEIETALFRVVQESLGNIHRHSGSTTAAVRIRRDAGTVRLEISDEGGGVPPGLRLRNKEMSVPVGVGIAGMRERLRQVGGQLEIESKRPRNYCTGHRDAATRRVVRRSQRSQSLPRRRTGLWGPPPLKQGLPRSPRRANPGRR